MSKNAGCGGAATAATAPSSEQLLLLLVEESSLPLEASSLDSLLSELVLSSLDALSGPGGRGSSGAAGGASPASQAGGAQRRGPFGGGQSAATERCSSSKHCAGSSATSSDTNTAGCVQCTKWRRAATEGSVPGGPSTWS